MKNKLVLEINKSLVKEDGILQAGNGSIVMMTPSIDEDYFKYRVRLSENQAIHGFPKFTVIGIGFAKEEDWNTNLPSNCEAEEIYNHIKCNKGDAKITKADCITAIKLIQEAVKKYEK